MPQDNGRFEMADAATAESIPEEEIDIGPGGGSKRLSRKRLILVLVAALLVAGGGFAAAHFTGMLGSVSHEAEGTEGEHGEPVKAAEPVYYELPEFVVNLNTSPRKTTFFKLRAKVELDSEEGISRLEARMPRIVDRFQVYLRELRPEDLSGSAGTYRLREELLRRLRIDLAPVAVRDILFVEMFVQ